jgi:plastocyanin
MRRNRILALPAILVALALAVVLFGAQASAATAPGTPAAMVNGKVKIVGNSSSTFAFQPSTVTIQVGQTVGWLNNSVTQHTTTSDTGLWDSGPINVGGHFVVRFPKAGTFTYHCSIHPFMTGTVIVQ